ncbi:MAG: FAD-dependent oxidoreductase [Bacteroidia bacterium]|nr:FAD-dependent oxidoreductase [Bacteroidia bacterium]
MIHLDILGGGPAGLFAGYYAKKAQLPFSIYEASGRIGGNCKTFEHGDFKYDSGAHRFHDKNPKMTQEILELMGDEMDEVFAPSFIFYKGKLIHFPITPANMFSKLDPVTLLRGVYHFLTDKSRIPEVRHFQDYAYRKYGKVIADLFLTNYSHKLWGMPTDQLSTNIAGSRLKELNLQTMITEFLYPNRKARHLEGAFFYPKDGFGRIMDRVGDYCDWDNIQLNSRITRIFHDHKRITAFEVNGETRVDASVVVSSLPLSLFLQNMDPVAPAHVLEVVRSMKFRHLKLVCIFLDREAVNNAATLYFPDYKYIFTRVYEPRNRSRLMSPPGKTSLIIEVPYSFGDNVENMSDETLLGLVREQFLSTGLIKDTEILDMIVQKLPFAYPILENDFDKKVAVINTYFDQFENLYHTGRSGKFEYSWTHNMMEYGETIVNTIQQQHLVPQL